MPPISGSGEDAGLARNFCEDRDPVAAESCSVSDDNQTFSFILKKRKSAAEPRDEDPSPGSSSPQSHPQNPGLPCEKGKLPVQQIPGTALLSSIVICVMNSVHYCLVLQSSKAVTSGGCCTGTDYHGDTKPPRFSNSGSGVSKSGCGATSDC